MADEGWHGPARVCRSGIGRRLQLQIADLVAEGRMVYITNCVVRHNPNLLGSPGPAIAALLHSQLEARMLHLPPGYTLQQKTHTMRAFPQLRNYIGDLYAFLAAAKYRLAASMNLLSKDS
jgi:hypothetical protein